MKKGFKQFDFVVVHWNDAWNGTDYKRLTENAVYYGKHSLPCHTMGHLLDYDDEHILVSQHYSDQADGESLHSNIFHIPAAMITKVEILKPARSRRVKKTKVRKRKAS